VADIGSPHFLAAALLPLPWFFWVGAGFLAGCFLASAAVVERVFCAGPSFFFYSWGLPFLERLFC